MQKTLEKRISAQHPIHFTRHVLSFSLCLALPNFLPSPEAGQPFRLSIILVPPASL